MNSMHYMNDKCNVSDDECSTGTEGDSNEITTLMLKNLPSRCRRPALIKAIDDLGFKGTYDFLYHPMKRNKCQNYGYAVINFKEPLVAKRFLEEVDGHQLKESSGKRLTVSQAVVQGLAENKMKFGILFEDIMDSSEDDGDLQGEELLPVPDEQPKRKKAELLPVRSDGQPKPKDMAPAYITLSACRTPEFVDTRHLASMILFRPPPGLQLPSVVALKACATNATRCDV
eukprot:TRINITY_DN5077_c0_g4_i1.p1 TRINITY_DN5077_c0_g4~~TRINITY_DN5077_c0_g4_i1.p1  ORF type:complete len:229 (-),score=56.87 TRINITY_DN5077_c0_g4_i1:112-798(-)